VSVVPVPLATPGEWSTPPRIWPTTFFRDCRFAGGCAFPLQHDPAIETPALRIFRSVVERVLQG
jgi:hypothetical protein